jgi:uncharacterized protein YecE (DUF72 family)
MVPDGFRFAIKGSRFCTNRRTSAMPPRRSAASPPRASPNSATSSVRSLWQLAPTKAFDPDEIRAFLALLPTSRDGIALRHALEVRHESFRSRAFVAMMRAANVAIVFADADDYPRIADLSADFVYARLRSTREQEPLGYSPAELDRWAGVLKDWAAGESPAGLDYVVDAPAPVKPRELFAFVISGAKVRNPAAARALISRLET